MTLKTDYAMCFATGFSSFFVYFLSDFVTNSRIYLKTYRRRRFCVRW